MSNDTSVAFIPFGAAYWGLLEGSDQEYQLKIATLFYDQIIFPVTEEHIQGIINLYAEDYLINPNELRKIWIPAIEQEFSLDSTNNPVTVKNFLSSKIARSLVFNSDGYLNDELILPVDHTIMHTFNLDRSELETMKQEDRYNYLYEATAVAISAYGSFLLFLSQQAFLPSCFLSFTPAQYFAAKKLSCRTPFSESALKLSPISALVPNASELAWHEILILRQDKRLVEFRSWLKSQSATLEKAGSVETDAIMTLWEAYTEIRPSFHCEVITGALGSIPIAGNVTGALSSIKSMFRALKHDEQFGYLMFLHRMTKKTYKRIDDTSKIRPRDLFELTLND